MPADLFVAMPHRITASQIHALRILARDEPRRYSVLVELCDAIEHLQRLEQAAYRMFDAEDEQQLQAIADLFEQLVGPAEMQQRLVA